MPGDLLGLRPRVLGRREYLPHVLNERLHRVRCCLRHVWSPLCSGALNRPILLRCRGQGVKHMHGPSQDAGPNIIPAEESGAWRPADGATAADLARLKASFPTTRDAVASIM